MATRGGVDQNRHRRVGFNDVEVKTLTVRNPFGYRQQPADIDVRGKHMPESDREDEQRGEAQPRRQSF